MTTKQSGSLRTFVSVGVTKVFFSPLRTALSVSKSRQAVIPDVLRPLGVGTRGDWCCGPRRPALRSTNHPPPTRQSRTPHSGFAVHAPAECTLHDALRTSHVHPTNRTLCTLTLRALQSAHSAPCTWSALHAALCAMRTARPALNCTVHVWHILGLLQWTSWVPDETWSSVWGGVGWGGHEGKKQFGYRIWASHFGLAIQNFIFPQRKIFFSFGWGGGLACVGGGGVRQITLPQPSGCE